MVVRDISDRKQIEEQLEQERSRLLAIFEELPASVYLRASDYSIPFCEPQVSGSVRRTR